MQWNRTTDEAFEALLRYMRDSRGFDFTGYKRTSLMRRVRHRMDQAGYASFEEYLDFLQASSDEFAALFNTILINVTSFFRDPEAWEYIGAEVIPRLLAERAPDDPIRVWSAGCASGQEAYTLAMVLAEALGPRRFGSGSRSTPPTSTRRRSTEARSASYDAKAGRVRAAGSVGALLRTGQRPLRFPQGPAPRGDLRPQRPGQGRADLARRPAGVPQHA